MALISISATALDETAPLDLDEEDDDHQEEDSCDILTGKPNKLKRAKR